MQKSAAVHPVITAHWEAIANCTGKKDEAHRLLGQTLGCDDHAAAKGGDLPHNDG